jgi:hypothetical protein
MAHAVRQQAPSYQAAESMTYAPLLVPSCRRGAAGESIISPPGVRPHGSTMQAVRTSERTSGASTIKPLCDIALLRQGAVGAALDHHPRNAHEAGLAARIVMSDAASRVIAGPPPGRPLETRQRQGMVRGLRSGGPALPAAQAAPDNSDVLSCRLFSSAGAPPCSRSWRKSDRCTATRLIVPSSSTSTAFQPWGVRRMT